MQEVIHNQGKGPTMRNKIKIGLVFLYRCHRGFKPPAGGVSEAVAANGVKQLLEPRRFFEHVY